jgi:DNA-binding response OmpR family regulator
MSLDGLRVPSVVVVEDNETLRDELVLYLSEEGFAVRGVGSGQELNDAMEALPTDILILDLNLPEEDGISITRRIRRSLPTVGIIMLTARLRSTDRLEGYASGADVYLTKPTRPEELVAVVRNLFSRLGVRVDPAPWEIDMAGSMLHSPKGLQIELTANEARLLMALTVNGQFLDHAALLSRFGGEAQSEKINKSRLEVLISRLRTKLGPHISRGFDICAVSGQSYQLDFVLVVKNMALGK